MPYQNRKLYTYPEHNGDDERPAGKPAGAGPGLEGDDAHGGTLSARRRP